MKFALAGNPNLKSITFDQETAPEIVDSLSIPTTTKIYVKSQAAKLSFEAVFTNYTVEVI